MQVLAQTQIYPEQLTLDIFTQNIFYVLASVFLFLAAIAIGFVDHGLVRRKNVLDTWIQKMVCALLAGVAMLIIGYGIWEWQFNEAFGVENPLGEALSSWWILGSNFTEFGPNIDPAVTPTADVLQIFGIFFFVWAAVFGVLLHSAGLERVKPLPMYIMAAVGGGLVMPFIAYLTWGSAGPLTNAGLHDYLGVYALYILVGVWALLIAWRAGPRLGSRTPHPETMGPSAHNFGWTAAGVALLLFALPVAILGCGYFVAETGYFGISLASSGMGLAFTNIFVSYAAGALGGALIAYKLRNPVMALLGPVAGYISCASAFDVYLPWQTALVAFGGPFVVYLGIVVNRRIGIDELKIVALTLWGGIYGVVVSGFIAWGTPVGGFFGIEEGEFAFQNDQITPWMQMFGVVIVVGIALVTGLALLLTLEKLIGLRVSERQELEGLDSAYWNTPPPAFQPAASAVADGGAEAASPRPVTPGGGASPGRTT